jgi:diguanylate cyclase (GGDEF)-like protein/PAS domain S-box-containing protein
MQKLRLPEFLIGLMAITLGVAIMIGWLSHNAALVRIGTGPIGTVFNTGLCFVAMGSAFVLSTFPGKKVQIAITAIGWAMGVLVSLVLLQYLTDVDLQIDWKPLHMWLHDTNPVPGRIPVSGCIGILLCATALILLGRTPSRRNDACIHFAILGMMLMGLSGLVGSALRIDLIYPSLRWPRTAVHAAVALMLLAAALWSTWHHSARQQARYRFQEDEKISFIGAAILSAIVLTIGLGGLSLQAERLEQTLSEKLWPILEIRHTLLKTSVKHGVDKARQAIQNSNLDHLTARLQRNPNDDTAALALHERGRGLLRSNFSGVAFLDTNGRELIREGHFVEKPELQTELGMDMPATLLWGDAYYLNIRLKIFQNGVQVGTFVSEQPLYDLTDGFFDVQHAGATGEIGLCFSGGPATFSCFPEARNPKVFHITIPATHDKPVAMSLAIDEGKEGILIGRDYRGNNIIAAYRPVLGNMGLIVKQDTAELFQPIREQVEWSVPLLLLFAAGGVFALRSQVKPIATQLLHAENNAKDREQRTRAVIDNVAEAILTMDEQGVVESFGGAASAIFGYSPEEVIGQRIRMLVPAEHRGVRDSDVSAYLKNATRKKASEQFGLRKDGSVFQMEFAINEVKLAEGNLFVVIARDVTERKQAEAALFEEKERLHVTLSSIGDAVITTDTNGCVVYLNPVAETMTGWRNDEAIGRALPTLFEIVNEKTNEPALNAVEFVLTHHQPSGLTESLVLISREGVRYAIEDSAAPIRDRAGKVIGAVLVFHDVSEARKMAAQMSYQATHDSLSGLINRREFERRLQLSLHSATVEHREHTLLYLDLDRFKIVNDTCGHVAGDELLRQLSGLLQAPLRQSDTLARMGGDEFCILLPSCATEPALRIAEQVQRTVSDFRFVWQDKAFPIGVSIGLVTFRGGDTTPSDIFRMADAACYAAKDKGRNRIQVYSPDDNVLAQRHGEVGWLDRIRKALDENRFVLYAQRIIPLGEKPESESDHGDHVELLLRMVEDGKLIPPMAFIPAAERYGLMPAIDRWVIREALADYAQRAAQNNTPGTYAINLSGASISDENFLEFVLEQFAQYSVPPHMICFEITETSAIANLTLATTLIQRLKSIGCRFSLDDFGSGMSSFAYLKHLPVDYLKIDGSFVKDMVDDPIDFAMVESINHIGHVMGIQTIAEFVENDAILDALRKTGVDFAQGYGVAKPVPLNATRVTAST